MFRELRRKQKAISEEAAKELMVQARRAVLAVNGDDGYPYAVPINYLYDEENQTIIFHGAKAGHKIDSIRANDKVCFIVYGNESVKEGEEWAPYVQSVVVFGRCRLIEGETKSIELVKALAKKYYPNDELIEAEVAESGRAMQMFEIQIEHMCGKQIQER